MLLQPLFFLKNDRRKKKTNLNLVMKTLRDAVVVLVTQTDGPLSYFCSLTELFTMNKHAVYCTNILYSVAVHDETILFDTRKGNDIHRSCISVCFLSLVLKTLFLMSSLAPSSEAFSIFACTCGTRSLGLVVQTSKGSFKY